MDLGALAAFGIVLVRIGMLVAATPLFGGTWAPAQVKVGLTVMLALVVMPLVSLPALDTPAAIALATAHEALVGLALSFSARVLLSAAELGGYLIGFQLGFGYAAIVDPQSGVRNNLLAALYGTLTLVAFLAANVHHAVIRLLVASYDSVPVVTVAAVDKSLVQTVARMLGLLFTTGAQLAAPVVLVLVIVELVMGVISRAAPSLNLQVIGAPLRLIVGLFALGTAISIVPAVVTRLSGWGVELSAHLAVAFR
jgi:flagellar biosynthetic protein FliR